MSAAPLVGVFLTSALYIGLKSFQQLNVVHRQYRWIVPLSIMMAACEAIIVVAQTEQGVYLPTIMAVGLGGGVGSCIGTWLHTRYLEKR